jgi:hypothetical protein
MVAMGYNKPAIETACGVVTFITATCMLQMCQVADMWGAQECLDLCFTVLVQNKEGLQGENDLETVLQLLPAAVQRCTEYAACNLHCFAAVKAACLSIRDVPLGLLLHCFGDVHALVSCYGQLRAFAFLPLKAVKLWAASDDLVVDSEDSVAVALGWWVGKRHYALVQREVWELAGLIRVRQLTAGETLEPAAKP